MMRPEYGPLPIPTLRSTPSSTSDGPSAAPVLLHHGFMDRFFFSREAVSLRAGRPAPVLSRHAELTVSQDEEKKNYLRMQCGGSRRRIDSVSIL